jgi:hypothetical protein
MAAGAWTFYNAAKKHLMDGTIDLDTNSFRMSLYLSTSNAATVTLSTRTSVTNEVAENYGYSSSGKPLASITWGAGASATEWRWNCAAIVWTAAGGTITGVKFAVIWQSSGVADKLVCFSQLSTAGFNVTTGNTLTITPSANGIFELN